LNLTPSDDSTDWLIPGLAGAALVGAGAFLFLRRRTQASAIEQEPARAAAPPPPPATPAMPKRAEPKRPSPPPQPLGPVTAAPVPPVPAPAAPLSAEPLTIATSFTAKAVRLSLVYATLQYELDITNAGSEPLPPLQVRADLASAHGSIGTREQLAPPPEALEAKHSVAALAPGETTTLKSEVRVPLQQIVPVKKGNAHFLVPLVRFCILAPDGAAVRRVFTAGPYDPGSNAIASVRLDAGPRNLRELNAREIEAARSFTLDPVGAQG
jgi:MYXO-CTERM domain-containing protein